MGHVVNLLQVTAIKSQYYESEAFHLAQIAELQIEIEGHQAEGSHKEAEARSAYLAYHQEEIKRIRGIIDLAGEKGSLMEEVINALKVNNSAISNHVVCIAYPRLT